MNIDFQAYYQEILNYFQANTGIAIALSGVFLVLLLKKPKLFFTIALIAAINLSVLYLISYTSTVSDIQKKRLISKTTSQFEDY